MNLQVTLFDKEKKYRPISTIVKDIESMEYYKENKASVLNRAIANICHQRKTDYSTLKKQGYTQFKVREYDLEKIKHQQLVNKLKAEHQRRQQSKEQ